MTDGDDHAEYYSGTFYEGLAELGDLSESIAAAQQEADWMDDVYEDEDNWIRCDASSIEPCLYIKDDTPELVRRFYADTCIDDADDRYCIIANEYGEVYECGSEFRHFDSASLSVRNGDYSNSLSVISNGGKYYLYDPTSNFYVLNTQKDSQKALEDYYSISDGKRMAKFDLEHTMSINSAPWEGDYAQLVSKTMDTMANVTEYWKDNYRINGIYGNGSPFGLIVVDGTVKGTAANIGKFLIECGRSKNPEKCIADAPEVLVHEFSHGVPGNVVGLSDMTPQCAALHEAISDIFAASYRKGWDIGAEVDSLRNIPDHKATMKDFFDYESFTGIFINFKNWLSGQAVDAHDNSYVVSHTVYEAWKTALDRDYETMGKINFKALRYLKSQATFNEYASAFVRASREFYSEAGVKLIRQVFEDAGFTVIDDSRTTITYVKNITGTPRTIPPEEPTTQELTTEPLTESPTTEEADGSSPSRATAGASGCPTAGMCSMRRRTATAYTAPPISAPTTPSAKRASIFMRCRQAAKRTTGRRACISPRRTAAISAKTGSTPFIGA